MPTIARVLLPALIMMGFSAAPAWADLVFQYRLEVPTGGERTTEVFLWIPHEAGTIRGAVVAGMTSAERELVKDAGVRQACADHQLAIVFFKSGLGAVNIEQVLGSLAELSGYSELKVAPLLFIGHSAGGPQAKNAAVAMADRCFGLIQSRGGGPWHGEHQDQPLPPVPEGIPCLMLVGQFDEFGGWMRDEEGNEPAWEQPRDAMVHYRTRYPDSLLAMIVEPGAGHFAGSPVSARFAAMFIAKSAENVIPRSWDPASGHAARLHRPKVESGWLTPLNLRDADRPAPAPFEDYTGPRSAANWHFDREFAEAAAQLHAQMGRKDQFIRWNERYWVDAGVRYYFHGFNWIDDGQSFRLRFEYADRYPTQHNNQGPRWVRAGEPVGNSGTPIRLRRVNGPLIVTGPDTMRIHYDALTPATEHVRPTFLAYSEGDETYRHTEVAGMFPRGFRGLTQGRQQIIDFPQPQNMRIGDAPQALHATSDADLPVGYHVSFGPAVVEDGRLRIAQVPQRAKFPIRIGIMAHQFGSGVEPHVRTAAPVERIITLHGPR